RIRGLRDAGESRRSARQTKVPALCGHFRFVRLFAAPYSPAVRLLFSRPTPYVVISDVLSNFPVTHARFLP
ncbi:hypothetical protein, partial [Burkholderia contaminans]